MTRLLEQGSAFNHNTYRDIPESVPDGSVLTIVP